MTPVGIEAGPVRFASDPATWPDLACGIVHREPTADERRTLVSETDPPEIACR